MKTRQKGTTKISAMFMKYQEHGSFNCSPNALLFKENLFLTNHTTNTNAIFSFEEKAVSEGDTFS